MCKELQNTELEDFAKGLMWAFCMFTSISSLWIKTQTAVESQAEK